MSADTDALYNKLRGADRTSQVTIALGDWFVQIPALDLFAALMPVAVTDTTRRNIVVNTDVLNVRSGPSTKHEILRTVKQGDVLWIIEQEGDWQRLDAPTAQWVCATFTKLYTPPSPPIVSNPPAVVQPAPPREGIGAFGRHYLGTPSDTEIANDHYRIVKAVDQPAVLQKLYAANPDRMFIFRHYLSDQEQDRRLRLMQTDMNGALNQWFSEMEPFLKAMPWAYFEGLNEVDAPDQYIEFERLRTLRLADKDIKACVLNLSVARSDKAMWARCKSLIDAVNAHGGIVGEHSYAMGIMSNNANSSFVGTDGKWNGELFPTITDKDVDNCWTGLRILQSKKHLAAQGQGQTEIVATEMGLGDTSDPQNGRPGLLTVITKGWRDCIPLWQRQGWLNGTTPEAFYLKQLAWWVEQTKCKATVFTFHTGGDKQWDKDDMAGVM